MTVNEESIGFWNCWSDKNKQFEDIMINPEKFQWKRRIQRLFDNHNLNVPFAFLPACRRVLLAGAGQRLRALPGVRRGFDSLSVPTRLLRLRRLELPQLCHGGAGGPLRVRLFILPLASLGMLVPLEYVKLPAVL